VYRVGVTLIVAGLAAFLLSNLLGFESPWVVAAAGAAWLLGSILLVLHAALRLYRGDVRLRPFDAARKAVPFFLIALALMLPFQLLFYGEIDWIRGIGTPAAFAILLSLHQTAYRRR
jgi:hypothetical protein